MLDKEKLCAYEQVYGLNFDPASLAIGNPFIKELNKMCYQLGKQLQPIGIFNNEIKRNAGVVDLADIRGMVFGEKVTMELAEYRAMVYEVAYGQHIDFCKGNGKDLEKFFCIDYLLSSSMCYIEIPKYSTKDGVAVQSYDKFLVTKNPAVIGMWMGMSASEMQVKYAGRVENSIYELTSGNISFAKCMRSKGGNSITIPRSTTEISKITTCIPLFCLTAFMFGLEEYHKNGILKFTYLKDNNTIRDLCTTTNYGIMMKYYKDTDLVQSRLSLTDYNKLQLGGLEVANSVARGYVKLPELGLSRYDETGVRALNVARLLSVSTLSEVDTSFIEVDLDSCVQNFYDALDYLVLNMPQELEKVFYLLCGNTAKLPANASSVNIVYEIHRFVDAKDILLSTTFHKALHLHMLANPELYPRYTGMPVARKYSAGSESFGVSTMADF